MGKRIGGTAYIKYDGKQLSLAGSMTVNMSRVEREGQVGLSGVAGFNEKDVLPFIEGEFFLADETSLEEIEGLTNATITAELANGQVATLSEAWNMGNIDVDAEGKFSTKFEGMRGEWS